MNLNNLISNEDNARLHELKKLAPEVKSKIFSLGRVIDKFNRIVCELGSPNDISKTPVSNEHKV